MQVGYQSMSLKYMERLTGFKRREYPVEDLEGLGSAISAGAGAAIMNCLLIMNCMNREMTLMYSECNVRNAGN